jgi:hypothetical protein
MLAMSVCCFELAHAHGHLEYPSDTGWFGNYRDLVKQAAQDALVGKAFTTAG